MLELSVSIVIVAIIAGFLINKFLDRKYPLNIQSDNTEAITALELRLKAFDERINDTWRTISSTKQELEAYKLVMGLKGK